MTSLEIILSIITALSGIGNLSQWLNLKAIREKSGHEADRSYIENLEMVVHLQAEEIKRLQDRQAELEERISQLEETKTSKKCKQ